MASAVLFLISLTFFMLGMYYLDWVYTYSVIGAIFFIAATIILAVMIAKRRRTPRS
jgi:hypothetical protein